MTTQEFVTAIIKLASDHWYFDKPLTYSNESSDYLWLTHSILFMSGQNEYDVGPCVLLTQNGSEIRSEQVKIDIKTAFRPREMSQVNVYFSECSFNRIECTVFHKGNLYKQIIKATPEISAFISNRMGSIDTQV